MYKHIVFEIVSKTFSNPYVGYGMLRAVMVSIYVNIVMIIKNSANVKTMDEI